MIFSKIRDVKSPQRGTKGSAGIDFFVPEDTSILSKNVTGRIVIGPGESVLIPSGIKVILPKGYALVFFNKSGVATKKGLQVGACVVDEDYRGEVHLHVTNVTKTMAIIHPGDKLVQGLLIQVPDVQITEVLADQYDQFASDSERGSGGFGSTGTR